MKLHNKSGFTLLEIIIVIIIIGVLASLALPRLFSTVEYSRSTEALASIATIRSSLERCYLQHGTYNDSTTPCTLVTGGTNNLDIPDPNGSPNAHFEYRVTVEGDGDYTVLARRNGVDNGTNDGSDMIGIRQEGTSLDKAGKGAYKAIGNSTLAWLVTW